MSDTAVFDVLDGLYLTVLDQVRREDRWLLWQTILTKEQRRNLVEAIPVSAHDRVLDAGCGFGALSFDIAIMKNARVVGVDISDSSLELASRINEELARILPVSPVEFISGDIYNMSLPADSFDFVIARFLFQHLDAPGKALAEMIRTVKPGGYVCLIDIDDQLEIQYPDLEEDVEGLYRSFRLLQKLENGDRMVGRKLTNYLYNAGCEIVVTILRPETECRYLAYDDPAIQFEMERLGLAKGQLITRGMITGDKFDEIMEKIRRSYPRMEWRTNSEVVALGRKKTGM